MSNNTNIIADADIREYTTKLIVNAPLPVRKVIIEATRNRNAAYHYRCGYVALINAMHELLCKDKVGYSVYDAIMAETKHSRAEAEKELAKDRKTLNISDRIRVIREWEKDVAERIGKGKGKAKGGAK